MKKLSLKTRNALLDELKTNSFINSSSNFKLKKHTVKERLKNDLPIEAMYSHLQDPNSFMHRYIKIFSPNKGIIDFKLNETQRGVLQQIRNTGIVFDGIIKRQVGTSTVLTAYMLWYALMHPGATIVSMNGTNQQTYNVREMFQIMIENLPEAIRPKVVSNTKQTIEFENGSVIKLVGSNIDAVRGYGISLIVFHDYEYFKDRAKADIQNVIIPVVSIYGKPVYL